MYENVLRITKTDNILRRIKEHKCRPIKKVHSTINVYRYRLKEPNDKYDYRIKGSLISLSAKGTE